ncbi:histidine phosphatase superfamily [Lophiotrema nucula]|uniref:Histidine phosphatase superfamily n=1 Tax=Lophiotrema nucula TaxID=690887 RepID=A0A6A5ZDK7_9PLEO|nr:histidine phosphatase superfamily [Lophiotrema nucula]
MLPARQTPEPSTPMVLPPAKIATSFLVLAAFVALFATKWGYFTLCPETCTNCPHSGYFEYECAGRPHQSSWSSWWHPHHAVEKERHHSSRAQRAGATTKDWNILYYLGGNGPWVEKVHNVVEGGIAVPDGCKVEQIHMMARHAERYPVGKASERIRSLHHKLKTSEKTLEGDLAFVNNWQLFWSDEHNGHLTTTGPFSGTLGAFTTGVRLRTRYHDLIDQAQTGVGKIRFWASDSARVIDTARYFAVGFFGLNWTNIAHLEVIPETSDRGGDTLTPGDTCPEYLDDREEGYDKGARLTELYRSNYLNATRERFLNQNPSIEFNDEHLFAMQEICGFETTVRGSSPWCDAFTQDEFISFEYARDLLHYYRSGPGTKYAGTMGWLWLNATTNLMLEGHSAGPLFLSFVHDGDIAPMITALDIINEDEHLPITHIPQKRRWRKSQVAPMGGRVIFEMLSCGVEESREKYVRININDGITALPDCQSGPGQSCPLDDFVAKMKRRGEELGDFREKCGLSDDAADRITFLHQKAVVGSSQPEAGWLVSSAIDTSDP